MVRLKRYEQTLKWCVLVLFPACATLLSGLGELYQWSFSNRMVATLNLITVFLGSFLHKANKRSKQRRHE